MIQQLQLHDNKDNLIAFLDEKEFNSWTGVDERNGEHTITIQLRSNYDMAEYFIRHNKIFFYDTDKASWQEFIISESNRNMETITIKAEASIYEALSSFISKVNVTGRTVINGLQEILDEANPSSNWATGTTDISGSYYMQRSKTTLKAAILDWAIKVGGILRPRIEVVSGAKARYIDIVTAIGQDRGKVVYDDRDLQSIVETNPAEEIYTAAYGYGQITEEIQLTFEEIEWVAANGDPVDKPLGQDYIELSSELTDIYGFYDQDSGLKKPRTTMYENTQISSAEELIQLTYDALVANVVDKTNYTLSVFDLKAAGYEVEEINLGDTVGIIVDSLGIQLKAEVNKITYDYLDPSNNSFEFGEPNKTISDNIQQIAAQAESAEEKANANYIASVLERWNTEANAGTAYVYTTPEEGICIYDAPIETATEVLSLKAGVWRSANSKTAGEWNWATIGTAQGIVADAIYTGVLRGENFEINLVTGEFRFGDRNPITGVIENPVMQFTTNGFKLLGSGSDAVDAEFTPEYHRIVDSNGNIIAEYTKNGAHIPNLTVDNVVKIAETRITPYDDGSYHGIVISINNRSAS